MHLFFSDHKITKDVISLADFYTLRKDVETVLERVEEIRASAGLKQLEKSLADLEEASGDSSLWDDRAKAQQTLQALTDVKEKIKLLNDFKAQVFQLYQSKLSFKESGMKPSILMYGST